MKIDKKSQNEIPAEAIKLLPWYATGWLPPEERNYIKKILNKFPELQEQVVTEHKIIQLIREDESLLEQSLLAPAEERLDTVLKKLKDNTKTNPETQTLPLKIKSFIEIFLFGGASRTQYAMIATMSVLSIGLLFTFISPLMKESNIFYPAALEDSMSNQNKDHTVLLVGLTANPDDPTLIKLLQESHATITAVPGKDGMYRIQLPTKLSPIQTKKLINKFSSHKELFWFTGEAY